MHPASSALILINTLAFLTTLGALRLAFFDLHLNSSDGTTVFALERWDEKLNHFRYGREKAAAICYGFSMYRPGKNPAVITLRCTSDTEK